MPMVRNSFDGPNCDTTIEMKKTSVNVPMSSARYAAGPLAGGAAGVLMGRFLLEVLALRTAGA